MGKLGISGMPDRTSLELLFRKITKSQGVKTFSLENFVTALEEIFKGDELEQKIDEINT